MSKPSLVIVLAEDVCHQRFIRHCLKQQNYERHQMSFEPIPGSRGGDAVKWVIERYAKEVQAFRTRSARAGTALIVAIDADTETVEHRTRHLARALAEGAWDIGQATSASSISFQNGTLKRGFCV